MSVKIFLMKIRVWKANYSELSSNRVKEVTSGWLKNHLWMVQALTPSCSKFNFLMFYLVQ